MKFLGSEIKRGRRYLHICQIILICISFSFNGLCESESDYYSPPVKHPIRLSGTFCELRPNHFHAGIDIRSSKGVAGDSLYSVADGLLSRVRVQRGSYGQVLYIDHDNGTTSVYAHLDKFHPKIEALIEKYQYRYHSSEIDIYLDSLKVNIDKGDYIGTMGNTGRSSGPHLHFEIRDTKTEEPINPFLYGFDVKDEIAPTILSVWVYALDKLGRIIERTQVSTKTDNKGVLKGTLSKCKSPNIAIGIGAFDKVYQYRSNKGIYGATVYESNDTICTYINDRFNFNENKGINGLIDYGHYKRTGARVTKLFQMQHQSLSLFEQCDATRGIIRLDSTKATQVTIDVFDYDRNVRKVQLNIEPCSENVAIEQRTITNNKSYVSGNIKLSIGADVLFEDCNFDVNQVGSTYSIGSSSIPLNKPIEVEIKQADLPDNAILVKKGTNKSFGGRVLGGKLITTISELGDFVIKTDTQPPTISTIRYSSDRSKYSSWKFTVTDNYSDKVQDSKLQIITTVDGRFIRSIFDSKSNSLTINDISSIPKSAQKLHITAIDIHGNIKRRDYTL